MQGQEICYVNAMVAAALEANDALLGQNREEAIIKSHVRFKGDTLGLDQIPENAIVSRLRGHNQQAAIITEERGEDDNPLVAQQTRKQKTFFVCDPTDRSSQFKTLLEEDERKGITVRDVVEADCVAKWESDERFGSPASITGSCAAITCVRRGVPICSVILNYVTQDLVVLCSAGFYVSKVKDLVMPPPNAHVPNYLAALQERNSVFHVNPSPLERDEAKNFVGFVGKPERGYPANIKNCNLFESEAQIKHHNQFSQPGGPTRSLYLTSMNTACLPLGFVIANGEKIGEWMHWLTLLRYATMQGDQGQKALRLFELSQDSSIMRDGYLLAPSPIYSVFSEVKDDPFGRVLVDNEALEKYPNPSKYRATLLLTPSDNIWALRRVEQFGYREIVFHE